jgi:N-methylhydantoinase A
MPGRIAVDVGGTFTDVCALDVTSGRIRIAKVPSTADPLEGILLGLERAEVDLAQVGFFAHGTTTPTNALITRNLPRAAVVGTRGFRDVIEIRRGTKDKTSLWDFYRDPADPYVRRRDRLSVTERVDYAGNVLQPLVEGDVHEVVETLRAREITTVAVCLLNSFANPEHEQRVREILERELPDVAVTVSSEVLPEIFEHERFSTTVINAVLRPVVGRYVHRLEEALRDRGYGGDLLLIHSGGGVMTPAVAERFAARLAASGIAAGAIASRHIARLAGFDNAIGLDMGGTSTDISLTEAGELRVTKEWAVEFDYPVCFPSIEVLTIGAGGGSIAWIDPAGSLRNGPQSAGAAPGPACYGLGGELPTNTDANLVLGRLGEELVGGELRLRRDLAEQAIRRHVAEPLGLDVVEAAAAIIDVANANMADALRLTSVRRGHDPREFALVVFGGAGPLHGAALARELSVPIVIVPPQPGIASALGCLLVDVRHDLATMFLAHADTVDAAALEEGFARLEAEARERLATEGVGEGAVRLSRSLDMRYLGQWRSLSVPVAAPLTSLDTAVARFHERHEREHSYRRDGAPVELYRLNVTAVGIVPKAELARSTPSGVSPRPIAIRDVRLDGLARPAATPVYRRDDLQAGAAIEGPCVVEQLDSTTFVPQDVAAVVDEWSNLRLRMPQ